MATSLTSTPMLYMAALLLQVTHISNSFLRITHDNIKSHGA